ncbi:SCO7613 C-terminal domain-containing membrane protein [Streptomyces sp. NPDC003327]
MDNSLPPADELVLVDRELARLDARRSQLLTRRAWLLQVLHSPVAPGPAGSPAAAGPWPAGPVADAAPRSAQNVLLTLGGTLLTIAAIAFTLVSWGSMGIGGRAAVLFVVTSAALGAPVALLRRGLVSTAEAVAALGLALTVLDAYAVHRVALPGADGLGYAAVASAVLAGVWAGYGSALSRLRIPLPAAVVAGQLPLPLAVLAAGGGPTAFAWVALVTAAADAALVLRARPVAVRVTAAVGGVALGAWALLTGGWLSLTAPWSGAALLLVGAVALLYVARSGPAVAGAAGAVAGVAAVAALGGLVRSGVPAQWAVPGYVGCGLALAALWRPASGGADAVRAAAAPGSGGADAAPADGGGSGVGAWLPRGVRLGLAGSGAGVLALGVAWALPPVAAGLLEPLARTAPVWSGEHAQSVLASYPATAVVVLLVVGAALATAPRLWARCGALVLGWAVLTAVPVSPGLPYAVTLALQLLTATAGLALAVRPGPLTRGVPEPAGAGAGARPAAKAPSAGWGPVGPGPRRVAPDAGAVLAWTAFAGGLASAAGALARGLDARGATFVALGVVLALCVAVAVMDRGGRRTVAACGAVLVAAGLVLAAAETVGLAEHHTGLALLLVPAATAAVGAKARPVALAVEVTGAAVGLLALAPAAASAPHLSLALALGGVIAAATALRPERRVFASWTAAALFLPALWVRLAAWEVTVPEAYALPVTVPALVVGFLRRRRDPAASSWTAYGPGLAATLVPSLAAAWPDQEWTRPLLLGVAALGVTLLGARFRLQAPLVLGGAALALVGLHELAPYVVQAVGALPRWLPPALAGLVLLATGATYEQRLRDARRLRERLGRMH